MKGKKNLGEEVLSAIEKMDKEDREQFLSLVKELSKSQREKQGKNPTDDLGLQYLDFLMAIEPSEAKKVIRRIKDLSGKNSAS